MKRNILIYLFILLLPAEIYAAEVKTILKATKSWDGGKILYPSGEAEVSFGHIKLKKDETLPFHCHPFPSVGYIASGKLEIEKMDGTKKTFKAGEAVAEVVNTWHRGHNLSKEEEVDLLIVYIGAKNIPETIIYNEKNKNKCKI